MSALTPAEEARYLRHLADEIGADDHLDTIARLVTSAVLIGRATRIQAAEKAARKGAGMVPASRGKGAARGTLIGKESGPTSAQTPTGPGPIPDLAGEDVAT